MKIMKCLLKNKQRFRKLKNFQFNMFEHFVINK